VGNCAPGVQVLDDRVDGIKEIVEREAPGITVEGAFDTTSDPASNFSAWEALLQRYPDALAYLGVCDPDLPNLIKLKAREPGADYAIVGANFVPETIQGLQEGIATASVGQSPFMQGYVPIRAVLEQLVNGNEIPEGWIDSGIEVVTPDEVDELAAREASKEATLEHYLPIAEEIFADLDSAVRPLSEYGT
jgi:ribose transport system substrate-binding protein